MHTTYNITKANYQELKLVQRKDLNGTEVEYEDKRGAEKKVWVNNLCSFTDIPAGLQIEQQFAQSGFKIIVTSEGRGTFTLIQANVMTTQH